MERSVWATNKGRSCSDVSKMTEKISTVNSVLKYPQSSYLRKIIADVRTAVMGSRRIPVRELSVVKIRCGSVKSINTEVLGMRRVSANFVPKLLLDDEKRHSGFSFSKSPWLCRERWRHFEKGQNWCRSMAMTSKKKAQYSLNLSETERKSTNESEQSEDTFGHFFSIKGDCSSWLCSKWLENKEGVLLWSFAAFLRCYFRKKPQMHASCERKLHHNDPSANLEKLVYQFIYFFFFYFG